MVNKAIEREIEQLIDSCTDDGELNYQSVVNAICDYIEDMLIDIQKEFNNNINNLKG